MRRWWPSLIFVLALGGCARPGAQGVWTSPGTSAPAPGPGPVQVIADPEALRDARALAAGRKEADQASEDQELVILSGSPESFERIRQQRGRLVPILRSRLAKREPSHLWTRAEAAFVLHRLNDPLGTAAARELMREPAAAAAVLSQISDLTPGDRAKLPGVEAFVLGHLEAPEPPVRRNAVHAAGELGSPAVNARLLALLREGKDPEGDVAASLSRVAPSPELLAHCFSALKKVDVLERYPWMMALGQLAEARDPALARAAIDACTAALAQTKGAMGIDSGTLAALDAVEKRSGSRAESLLVHLLQSPGASQMVRASALDALVRRAPARARALALGLIHDAELSHAAVRALGATGRGTADEGLIQPLVAAAERAGSDPDRLGEVSRSLLKIGGKRALAAAVALADRLPPADRMAVRWAEQGLTAEKALRRLETLKVLDAGAAAKARRRLVAGRSKNGEGAASGERGPTVAGPFGEEPLEVAGLTQSLFEAAGLLTSFDAETGELPVRHDRLLQEFAKQSGGAFRPEATFERWEQKSEDDEDAPYTVQFIHRGRLFRFTAQNLGDWYDVGAVVAAANQALAEAGEKRRYVPLESGDQVASFVFVEPEAFRIAARELFLPIGSDPDAARQSGKAFEEHVADEIWKGR